MEAALPWLLAAALMVVANVVWAILSSFFSTILPTKRNLLTYLDKILVIAMAMTCTFQVKQEEIETSYKSKDL